MIDTETRNATLADLAGILQTQQAAKLDVVAPASTITSINGILHIDGADAIITDEGVTSTFGRYRPTAVADEGLADKLGVPVAYLKRLRNERPDLYDANINGWLHGGLRGVFEGPGFPTAEGYRYEADARKFLVRCFRAQEGGEGVARAFLSDGYKIIDNFDVLTSALDGVRASGAEVTIEGCDLSERRMSVRVVAPAVQALAPTLLANYRSPFDQGVRRAGGEQVGEVDFWRGVAAREGMGYAPGTEPVVFGGFVISNSETGGGAFTITPRLMVKICRNGLTITVDAMRNVHLGGRMDAGIIKWSDETQETNLALVRSQAKDAVTTFLDEQYVKAKVAEIEEKAGAPVVRPEATVKVLGERLRMPQALRDEVLGHFIMGGQMTAGGLVNAMTSVAQTLASPDDAAELEGMALRALEVVA